QVIRLTVHPPGDPWKAGAKEEDTTLTPPLDLVIGTKWKSASVNWNGTDPIL
ncbi:unnamed protein product, partial [Discosporangium mesarthrocarpum]